MKLKYICSYALMVLMFAACNDLDLKPLDEDEIVADTFFDSPEAFQQALAKIYGGLYLTGQQSSAGQGDISGDEGQSSYLRTLYQHQVYTTDEAFVGSFNDPNIEDFQNHSWDARSIPMTQLYGRFFYQITAANALIEQGDGSSDSQIQAFVNEARFLRALSYWHALDVFRNVPFVTSISSEFPPQGTPQQIFEFIESELLDLEDLLPAPGDMTYYPRATQGAVQMLLAKLYLNAQVYIGQDRYADALNYTNRVIAQSAYTLHSDYDELFLSDNENNPEFIFAIAHDGSSGAQFGGLNFIMNAATGGDINNTINIGVGGWSGTRTTAAFVDKFVDDNIDGSFDVFNATDTRANFFTNGHNKEIEELSTFTDGYAVVKFRNVDSNGNAGSSNTFVDTDFPVFRLADAYLMYAECFARGVAGADGTTAAGYVNALRERAYGNTDGNISDAQITEQFIIDERARELYWECHRRTDLIRFGLFTGGDYLWPTKGGNLENGVPSEAFRDIFPIPATDVNANPNLEQNDGYN